MTQYLFNLLTQPSVFQNTKVISFENTFRASTPTFGNILSLSVIPLMGAREFPKVFCLCSEKSVHVGKKIRFTNFRSNNYYFNPFRDLVTTATENKTYVPPGILNNLPSFVRRCSCYNFDNAKVKVEISVVRAISMSVRGSRKKLRLIECEDGAGMVQLDN
jgi:hypothetical protein